MDKSTDMEKCSIRKACTRTVFLALTTAFVGSLICLALSVCLTGIIVGGFGDCNEAFAKSILSLDGLTFQLTIGLTTLLFTLIFCLRFHRYKESNFWTDRIYAAKPPVNFKTLALLSLIHLPIVALLACWNFIPQLSAILWTGNEWGNDILRSYFASAYIFHFFFWIFMLIRYKRASCPNCNMVFCFTLYELSRESHYDTVDRAVHNTGHWADDRGELHRKTGYHVETSKEYSHDTVKYNRTCHNCGHSTTEYYDEK